MVNTRLGWTVITSSSSSSLTDFPWVTGKVRKGDAATILDYYCRRYNAEVETIRRDWSWGWSYRAVRGASVISEHAAGTAIDLNAPKHGLGTSLQASFSAGQIAALRNILDDPILRGCIRHGGWYAGRKDPMHAELQGGAALLAKVAADIRAGGTTVVSGGGGKTSPVVTKPSASKPAAAKPSAKQPTTYAKLAVDGKFGATTVKAVQVVMRAIKTYTRAVDGQWGTYTIKAVQTWLRKLGYYPASKYVIDGKWGKYSVIALQKFLRKKGLYKRAIDGDFGAYTVKAFQQYLNKQR